MVKIPTLDLIGDELCNNGGGSENFVCCLCQKEFPSNKSLCGHMRTHPERTWRGIQPPQGANRRSSSSAASDGDSPEFKFNDRFVDLSKRFTNWPVTAKRSRASVSNLSSEDPMQDTASTLVLFAITVEREVNTYEALCDLHSLSGRKKRKVIPEHPAEKFDSFKSNSLAEAHGVCRKIKISDNGKSGESDDEKSEFETGIKKFKRNKGKKRRIVYEETKEAVAGEEKKTPVKQPENCNVNRCSTCGRTFSTHQALGGHRSRHKKGTPLKLRLKLK